MERGTFKILFYFRKNKLKKDGKAPLLMRLTVNGKRWDSALKEGVIKILGPTERKSYWR